MKKFLLLTIYMMVFATQAFSQNYGTFDLWRNNDRTKIFTPPAATDTIVGRSSTDTLTNKTINGSNNTITNITATTNANLDGDVTSVGNTTTIGSSKIVNSMISATALIDYSKLGTMTTGQVLLGNAGVATPTTLSGGATVGATGVVTLGNSAVITQILTGYTSGAGTVSSSDSVLQAIQKLNGNTDLKLGVTKSQLDVSPVSTTEIQVPFSQLTTTASGKRIIETGSSNELRNPNFEATTYSDGWTCSSGTMSQAVSPNGYRALGIVSAGSGFRCYQTFTSTADLKGTLAKFSARIKTGAPDVKMCGLDGGNATANEVGCVTINPTNAGKVFDSPTGFFNYGDMVYGVVIYTTNTSVFPTVIANTSMGAYESPPISTFSNTSGWSDCGLTTADFQGFGTPSAIQLQCKRDTTDLLIRGKFASGVPTGAEARINLKLGGISLTSANSVSIPSLQVAGKGNTNIAAGTNFSGASVLIEPSVNYIAFGGENSTGNGITKIIANGLVGSGSIFSFNARIPIAGWEANTNASIAGCVDVFGCTDTFTALSSATGVISNPNVTGWISNASSVSAGVYTFPIKAGMVTGKMNCTATGVGTTRIMHYTEGSSSTTKIVFTETNTSTSINDIGFIINCQKGTADFKPKTVVVMPNLLTDISVSYYLGANFATTTAIPINFNQRLWDNCTPFCVTTSPTAWKFTAPKDGVYRIGTSGSATTSVTVRFDLYMGGTLNQFITQSLSGSFANSSVTIKLRAGEYVDIRPSASVTAYGGAVATGACKVEIERTGEY